MNDRPADRRVGRSRRLLKGALMELIHQRPYESITVEQIARRADVGRSTFYSHFTSKDDLLLDGFDHFLLAISERPGTPDQKEGDGGRSEGFRFSLPLLRHIHSQRDFFLATIVGASDPQLRARVITLFVEMVRRELQSVPDADGEAVRVARAHAVAGAFLGIAAWWLEQAPEQSAEFVHRVFNDTLQPGSRVQAEQTYLERHPSS